MVTQGPIFASFSRPSTNSDITLKIIQLFAPLISAQSLSLNALRILSSSANASFVSSSVVLFFFDFIIYYINKNEYTRMVQKVNRLKFLIPIILPVYFIGCKSSVKENAIPETDTTWAMLPFHKVDSMNP